jgi:hypothetical protein
MTDVYVKPSPPPPCDICGSTQHGSGYHDSGSSPEGLHDVGYPDTLETEQVLENRPND